MHENVISKKQYLLKMKELTTFKKSGGMAAITSEGREGSTSEPFRTPYSRNEKLPQLKFRS
eukprot:CAMPEP_0170509064 /NCGR_PEP_ID=MMETSP0208-20121228/64271_1 /TAXON_ID=197538 /ORGANISM="Strombidium inclinatum, Strain S3" /LENGTH=60 /DNA_ID=CAMNT_0010792283 /DNA_START=417 /DNA_END=599 /DNA_ORIENTATION=-